jgi:dolichol-phosphate mannosyltransferase
MLHFAVDGITSFSAKPLRIASYMGMLAFVLGLAYAIYAIVQHVGGRTIPGWTSLLVTILVLGGIQLLSLGIIGEYLARIFNESKSRPLYFIKDRIN